ncbi:hypothetical protein [Paenibacillus azoreducens]|uniref:Transposase n=1 Tax=Paenibacillus azoreducens TaxID=116718 RepID=A0A920CRT6_9BACL|nr:hypothetical protein [Paenibacillus azoreducens]GIO46738.1 hypothetical protein J34TS1_15030 [Paenibacillus azoreducens]
MFVKCAEPSNIHSDFRALINLQKKLIRDFSQVRCQIQNWLDCFFPKYGQVFKDWEGKASLITLSEFPTPTEIVMLGPKAILCRWKKDVKRAVGYKRAVQLFEAANQSIELSKGLKTAEIELRMLLEKYKMLGKHLTEILTELRRLLVQISGAKEMLVMPDLSIINLASYLSELEHPRNN